MTRWLPLLLLTACGEIYIINPERETATITRVFSTPKQTQDFCNLITGQDDRVACNLWAGDRSVQFLPYGLPAMMVSGHETEHAFSGKFHK